MLSLLVFLPVLDIWWILIKSMEKDEVMWLFMIPSMDAWQSLRQSTQKF